MTDTAGTRLVVRRPRNRWRDRLRAYRIRLDGREVGAVADGSELIVEVRPGVHVVRAVIDWSGSPEVRVSVEPGTVVTLVVTPTPGNALYNIGGPDTYLRLAVQA